ncbi:hypothetical protein KQH41_00060 [bacterium]|nr:hypothetical protein [bacterium]
MRRLYLTLGLVLCLGFTCVEAFAETLTVVTGSPVAPGATNVSVDIYINTDIHAAGAAFTVTYNNTVLSLSEVDAVTSDYFYAISPAVVVGGESYDTAIAFNPTTSGVMLAGAKPENGTTDQSTRLFTLSFDVAAEAEPGDYPISITQSQISNADAGYAPNTPIPMLVYVDGTTFQSIDTATIVGADLSVSDSGNDTDFDGIDDTWEMTHFNTLDIATATSDFDGDGYSDLQESINGAGYDPKVINAPGGPGYVNNLPDSFIYNFPDFGLYTYSQSDNFSRIHSIPSSLSVAADVDADGVDEVVSYFIGHGIYVHDNLTWNRIATAPPESIVKFGQGIAVDFGSGYGLYIYSTSTNWTLINSADPSQIVEADIDSDGIMELIVSFSGIGTYYYDNGAWSNRLTGHDSEQILRFGKGIAVDFGSTIGLYIYNTAQGWLKISSNDPSNIVESDIDSDGVTELIVAFPGFGIYYYNSATWSSKLTGILPDQMISLGNGIAVDFGSTYGLYTYSSTQGWTRISSADPNQLGAADYDNDNSLELSAYFSGYGLYIWDNATAQWSRIATAATNLTGSGNLH